MQGLFLALLLAPDFARDLWPHLERAQCRLCHQDNGVGATTRLQFPPSEAGPDELGRFGQSLRALIDSNTPANSLLYRKPTNRTAHAGGERIKPSSDADAALLAWVNYLAATPPPAPAPALALGPPRPVLRRLTHSQYNNTVRDLAGEESRPADAFPKEDYVNGFTNQVEGQSISPLLAAAYANAAERIARNAFRGGDARGLLGCQPSAACRDQFIRRFGRRAFRRPLNPREERRYLQLFESSKSFYGGAQLVVETMLQSPHFLLHAAQGPFATASRLSYFLWDSMPDEALLRAAESGSLDVERQVRRMLNDERARAAMDTFLAQWLRFDRLRSAIRDRRLFPEFTTELVNAMTGETTRHFRSLVWDNRDFREFFTSSGTFLAPELSRIYGLPAPSTPWDRVEFGNGSGRAGIFGQAYFLAVTSKPAETSPTERGLFVREHFLCQQVPPPPAGVNTTLPAVTDERPIGTIERLAIHLSNPVCAGCHTLVDPIGFGFERFDPIGRQRATEKVVIHPTFDELKSKRKTKPTEYDLPIEPKGYVRGLPDSDFASPAALGRRLAAEPACHRCIVKQLFRYANGKLEDAADRPGIDAALARFQASNFNFQELIIAIASHDAKIQP
ncbi:MAG: DUF1592 domain-containing protein [Acidobacteria bacterium]|nr:DUF1592 domain-containing protein [Acidobacteriota bacterium]